MAAAEMVVEGKDVWKTYGSGETAISALQGVNVQIRRGELGEHHAPAPREERIAE